MNNASWIIRHKDTKEAVLETWNESVAKAINTDKYEAITAYQYLVELNQSIKAIS